MTIRCDRCGDVMLDGDDYYENDCGCYCPDCFDWLESNEWKRIVGDTIERI